MQSLCNNNVLGIVVNGARRGELYSKYTYYHSYYTPKEEEEKKVLDGPPMQAGENGHGLGLSTPHSSAPVAEAAKPAAPEEPAPE
jgi:hypothetical protein